MSKRTLILGATPKADRYAYLAANRLMEHGHELILVGRRAARLHDLEILDEWPEMPQGAVHTVTMYMRAENQRPYYEHLIKVRPERVIFNPGTENPELQDMLISAGISYENSCTLVLLSTGAY